MKWYFYINWGSGYVLVQANNIKNLNLKWKKSEINDIIQRKKLEGSFTLNDSDAIAAKTYFITNGNYEAPIRIYENGDSGTGVLKFEGWCTKQGSYNFSKDEISLTNFRTNDQYTELLKYIDNQHIGENIAGYDQTSGVFNSQGQNPVASKLYEFSFSSPSFSLVTSTTLSNLGKCSMTSDATGVVIYDSVNSTLSRYVKSGGVWGLNASVDTSSSGRVASLTYLSSGNYRLTYEAGYQEEYALSGSTFSYLPSSYLVIEDCKHVSTGTIDGALQLFARTSDSTKTISNSGGEELSAGEIKFPSVCSLHSSNSTIAFIDGNQQKLKAFQYSGGFTEIASLQLSGMYAPKIARYADNQIVIHDAISGKLEKYNYSSGAWTKDGNTYTLLGGYTSTISVLGTQVMVAVSDFFTFFGSTSHSLYQLVNGLLYLESIDGAYPNYLLQPGTTSGSSISVDDFIIGDMSDVTDNIIDSSGICNYKYKLSDVLAYFELFQNYWYVDSNHRIKYIQPNLFSSIGTTFDITSLGIYDHMNERDYKSGYDISFEEIVFLNSNSTDFDGNVIEYARNTNIYETTNYNYTTDLERLVYLYTRNVKIDVKNTGLILHIVDNSLPSNTCASGTGIVSGSDTRNYKLSQTQIYNDYWKDYRYQETGNITINGSSSPVQDTVRNIIEFPELELTYGQLGITEFPNEVSSVIWDTGVKSFITEFSVNLGTNLIVINSRLLDL